MGELQIYLLIVGAAVIVGVIVYNRVQEARFRRRAEQAFAPERGDALLEAGHAAGSRIEPQLQPEAAGADYASAGRREPRAGLAAPAVPTPAATQPAVAAPAATSSVDAISYAAELDSRQPIPAAALQTLTSDLGALARRVRLEGRSDTSDWAAMGPAGADSVQHVRILLQLADRSGAVTPQEIATFQSAVARCAASLSASAAIPESAPFVKRARDLDTFCAQVDVVVGLNVLARAGKPITGARLRGLAEAAGFQLADQGAFVYLEAHGTPRFTLENQQQPAFSSESLRTLSTQGITLLLDVPRVVDGVAAFDQMVDIGRHLAASLGGTLVDDNRAEVTPHGLEQIRDQLRSIYAAMEAAGTPAGGPLALRLFA
jgi:FtsZ-interacting cell division protein ZipA